VVFFFFFFFPSLNFFSKESPAAVLIAVMRCFRCKASNVWRQKDLAGDQSEALLRDTRVREKKK
jgi:hypothetical protein